MVAQGYLKLPLMSQAPPNPGTGQASNATEFLADFSAEDLEKTYSIGELQHFATGQSALTEGDPDTSVYIVLEGQAEVSIPGKRGLTKVATLLPGSIFGELSFFDRMPRSARVSIVADCAVLKISEDSFRNLAANDAAVALAFVRELSKILSLRVRHLNQLVKSLSK